MREDLLVPDAPTLLESLRAVGYSFETAIADLIDNSITARASTIRIEWRALGRSYVAVLDDGEGMSASDLHQAMRHGSSNPQSRRSEMDLGRFGLGMKTASLSQARRLTVISLLDGCLSGRCWDLDVIGERRDWVVLELDDTEVASLPHVDELLAQGNGTLVLWEKLDRVEAGESNLEKALAGRMDATREHLALVFHRYLAGDPGSAGLTMTINNAKVEPLDPFLRANRTTVSMPVEKIMVDGVPVLVQPFILPHISRLKTGDLRLAGGQDGLRRHQGFYVYRNRRLIVWGTWFRLVRQEELTKLARVQVDVPNTLDHLWTLDIKKSVASPPEAVREGLKRIVERIAEGSRRVYSFKGRRSPDADIVHLWDRLEGRDGVVSYEVNRKHQLVDALRLVMPEPNLPLLERFLQALEVGLPKDAIYNDMAAERSVVHSVGEKSDFETFLCDLAGQWVDAVGGRGSAGASILLEALPKLEPFNRDETTTRRIIEGFING